MNLFVVLSAVTFLVISVAYLPLLSDLCSQRLIPFPAPFFSNLDCSQLCHSQDAKEGSWILGGGGNNDVWGGEMPSASWIDEISPHNHVWLIRMDSHMALANSLALRIHVPCLCFQYLELQRHSYIL
ncbi:hypothetical protein CARUB_v10021150mg [Capsella rubella]|uniref:Uncharacterized protein n=1 Tax=Capsella rubella TaxID=81985 RepID=R0IGE8_9BRAS|nr:hypothetical protein CARUB_v10021150mg [Capsella rubella]